MNKGISSKKCEGHLKMNTVGCCVTQFLIRNLASLPPDTLVGKFLVFYYEGPRILKLNHLSESPIIEFASSCWFCRYRIWESHPKQLHMLSTHTLW